MLLQSTLSPHLPVNTLSHCWSRRTHLYTTSLQTAIMVHLILMFTVVIIECAYGRPQPKPLPIKDGCHLVYPEVGVFRVEGEAVILSFPAFNRALKVHNIAPPAATFLITKNNGTENETYQGEGRVQQIDKQLWFLPAKASDTGEYICTYRNDTYCVTGSIKLQVFESSSVDTQKVSYPISVTVGERLTFRCPSISNFNKTDRMIEWYKDSSPTEVQLSRDGSFQRDRGHLKIPAVKQSHAGVYTCKLKVLINNQQYKVSRAFVLSVQDPPTTVMPTVPDLSVTSDSGLIGSYRTVNTPVIRPPVIISPLNGTIFKTLHGSGLELFCKVLSECQMAESTGVTWLVSGQSVESSYLDGRALLGGRRVTRLSEGCQIEVRMIIVSVTEEDVETELKCVTENQAGRQEVVAQLQLEDSTFTWLVVALVAISCFLAVVSVFLYVLFKPKRTKKMDYFLARQNSTF